MMSGMTALAGLPKVNGPHRNRALAAARAARAVELRTQGWTYQRIADDLGYSGRGPVYEIVSKALRAQTLEAVEDLRDLESERLDALQQRVWTRAMDGDVTAARTALQIIVARCRLLGLDTSAALTTSAAPRTVVHRHR